MTREDNEPLLELLYKDTLEVFRYEENPLRIPPKDIRMKTSKFVVVRKIAGFNQFDRTCRNI